MGTMDTVTGIIILILLLPGFVTAIVYCVKG